MTTLSCTAEVSTTEEPDAGKPHVRDCAGGAGQPALLPRDALHRKGDLNVLYHWTYYVVSCFDCRHASLYCKEEIPSQIFNDSALSLYSDGSFFHHSRFVQQQYHQFCCSWWHWVSCLWLVSIVQTSHGE